MTFPPLPTTLQGLSGPIKILRPRKLADGDEGAWLPHTRTILVKAGFTREYAWYVLLHEIAHATETDAGFLLPEDERGSTHDALASGFMHVVRHLVSGATSQRSTQSAPKPRTGTKLPKPPATRARATKAAKGRK